MEEKIISFENAKEEYQFYLQKANSGDLPSMIYLSRMLASGFGVKRGNQILKIALKKSV